MKTFRAKSGPFAEQPYYKDDEIESICLNELRSVALLPATPERIRIDRFIEKRFSVTPQYEDLTDGVLGLTTFGAKGVQEIVVARALDDEGSKPAERRIRSTLAHEAGHGLLHAHLFALGQATRPLFGDFSDPNAPKVLCRDIPDKRHAAKRAYDGRWWEFQANRVIGALLLPRPLVEQALEPFCIARGSLGARALDPGRRLEAAESLARDFDVNLVVARIRVEGMHPIDDEKQLSL